MDVLKTNMLLILYIILANQKCSYFLCKLKRPAQVRLKTSMWSESAQSCPTLWPHGLYCPWNSPGQNTGVVSLSFLQGIFPTQGLNPDLLHCRWILYQLSHKGSPQKLEWVAYPLARSSSWPRNRTGVSCFADRFFTNWAIREALQISIEYIK